MPSNFSRRSKRKRQTRLAFDPVNASCLSTVSPARVPYEASSSQSKPFNLTSPVRDASYAENEETQAGLTNLSVHSAVDDSDSDLNPTPTFRRQRLSQTRKLTQPRGALPLSPQQLELSGISAEAHSFMSSNKKQSSVGHNGVDDDSSAGSSPEEDAQASRTISRQFPRSIKTPRKQKTNRTKLYKTNGAGGKGKLDAVSDDEDAITVLPTPQRTGSSGAHKPSSVYDDSRGLNIQSRISPTSSRWPLKSSLESEISNLSCVSRATALSNRNLKDAPVLEDGGEEDEDVFIRSSLKRLRRHAVRNNEEHDTGDDDEDPISSPIKRRRIVIDDDPDSDSLSSPFKRFRPRHHSENEWEGHDDLAKGKRKTRQRQQKKPHRTKREKQLELLRRQRAGEKITDVTTSDSEDNEPQHGVYDTDSDLHVLSEFEDEEKDEGEELKQVHSALRSSNQNDDGDEFIVNDNDDPLGVPVLSLHDVPLEFTHNAHKPLKEHFKDAVEWMVQNKINPAFNRGYPIYVQAFRKLDIEVHAYASSIYSSAAWKEAFIRALWARPVFLESEVGLVDENEGRKCDACGRTNHPAKFEIQFDGKAYHKDTLDEVDNNYDDDDDNDDSDDSSSKASVNSKGQSIPSTSVTWYVGRFCKANAQTAHTLIHWKYALNEWVINKLKSDGHLAADKLAEREGWSKQKRSKHANRIVDEWESEKEIKALYRDFKINLETARQGKPTRWSK